MWFDDLVEDQYCMDDKELNDPLLLCFILCTSSMITESSMSPQAWELMLLD